jgi:hypothetical protein
MYEIHFPTKQPLDGNSGSDTTATKNIDSAAEFEQGGVIPSKISGVGTNLGLLSI